MNTRLWLLCSIASMGLAVGACSKSQEAGQGEREADPPEIVSFDARPAEVGAGEATELRWITKDAEAVEIFDSAGGAIGGEGALPASGSLSVVLHASTVFTLVAEANGETATGEVTVRVKGAPAPAPVASIDVVPRRVSSGDAAVLSWTTSDADSIRIEDSSGTILVDTATEGSGERTLNPTTTTTFVLTASSHAGLEAVASVTVEVDPALGSRPTVATFEAAEPVVSRGPGGAGLARLSWAEVEGAETLEIEGDTLDAPIPVGGASGSVDVQIEADTTFTLRAANEAGETSRQASVRVVELPVIHEFSAELPYVGAGEIVRLAWATSHGAELRLEREGVALPLEPGSMNGETSLPIAETTRFELIVTNEAGDAVSESLIVEVGGAEIVSFTAAPPRAWPGSTLTFDWETLGATSLVILDAEGVEVCTGVSHDQVAEGRCSTIAGAPGLATYWLEAKNDAGQSATASVEVEVEAGPTIERFTVSPTGLLAGSNVTVAWSVAADPDGVEPTLDLVVDRGGPYPQPTGPSGTSSFALGEPGSYEFTLIASTTSPASVPASATATIQVYGVPSVSLMADPSDFGVGAGEVITLLWTSGYADSLILYELDENGIPTPILVVPESERASGSFPVVPTAATTYRIVATNEVGVSSVAEASVAMAPTEILSFTASPLVVQVGDDVVLEWTTRSATAVALDLLDGFEVAETSATFIDVASSGGTKLPLLSCHNIHSNPNEGCAVLNFPVGFVFPFGGVDRTQVKVSAKGVLTFDVGITSISYSNGQFPSVGSPWAHLGVFWVDQTFASSFTGGNVWWAEGVDVDGRYLAIQWKQNTFVSTGPDDLNYEILLRESGAFEYRYGTMHGRDQNKQDRANGGLASVGFQTPDRSEWLSLHYSNSVASQFPGGFENRSFAFQKAGQLPPNGSYVWQPQAPGTKALTLFATGNGSDSAQVVVEIVPRSNNP